MFNEGQSSVDQRPSITHLNAYVDYCPDKFPPEMPDAERVPKEREEQLEGCRSEADVAYKSLATPRRNPDELQRGVHRIQQRLSDGHIFINSYLWSQSDPAMDAPGYIKSVMKLARGLVEEYKNTPETAPEELVEAKNDVYYSKVDCRSHYVNDENWMLHSSRWWGKKESIKARLEEFKAHLEAYLKDAEEDKNEGVAKETEEALRELESLM